MLPAAREAWLAQSERFGNPSSLHASGRQARRAVEESRERIAGLLAVRPSAVVFTASGTEADNLAVKGLFWSRASHGPRRILVSAIEHHAVLDPAMWLAQHDAADVTLLPVDRVGRVDPDRLLHELTGDPVALCSVMWANNEIGTIQPVAEIAAHCRAAGVPFHADAVQAVGHVDVGAAEVDALTISGHKIGGPFGVGALVVEPRRALVPVLHGGGQERDVRSGTLDAPAIVAFGVAVEHAVTGRADRARHLHGLRERLVRGVHAALPEAVVNGDADPSGHLPGIVHMSFPGCEGDLLLMLLDAAGIDCSTGSACTAGVPEPSHVLLALGVDDATARSSLRFSFGEESTAQDVDTVIAALPGVVERARRAGSVSNRSR